MKDNEIIENMTQSQKQELKNDIIKATEGSFSTIVDAKIQYNADIEHIKDTYGLGKATIKKLVKEEYQAFIEDEKRNIEEFEELYKQVMES